MINGEITEEIGTDNINTIEQTEEEINFNIGDTSTTDEPKEDKLIIATMSKEELLELRDLPYTVENFILLFKRCLALGFVRTDNIPMYAKSTLRNQHEETMEDIMNIVFVKEFMFEDEMMLTSDVIIKQIPIAKDISWGFGEEKEYPLKGLRTQPIAKEISVKKESLLRMFQ